MQGDFCSVVVQFVPCTSNTWRGRVALKLVPPIIFNFLLQDLTEIGSLGKYCGVLWSRLVSKSFVSDQLTGSTSLVDHARAVKEYSRSSADQVSFICLLLVWYSVFFRYIICLLSSFFSSFSPLAVLFSLSLSVLVSDLFCFLLLFFSFIYFGLGFFFPLFFPPLTVFLLCPCFSDFFLSFLFVFVLHLKSYHFWKIYNTGLI